VGVQISLGLAFRTFGQHPGMQWPEPDGLFTLCLIF
jgi:hypothetical protein